MEAEAPFALRRFNSLAVVPQLTLRWLECDGPQAQRCGGWEKLTGKHRVPSLTVVLHDQNAAPLRELQRRADGLCVLPTAQATPLDGALLDVLSMARRPGRYNAALEHDAFDAAPLGTRDTLRQTMRDLVATRLAEQQLEQQLTDALYGTHAPLYATLAQAVLAPVSWTAYLDSYDEVPRRWRVNGTSVVRADCSQPRWRQALLDARINAFHDVVLVALVQGQIRGSLTLQWRHTDGVDGCGYDWVQCTHQGQHRRELLNVVLWLHHPARHLAAHLGVTHLGVGTEPLPQDLRNVTLDEWHAVAQDVQPDATEEAEEPIDDALLQLCAAVERRQAVRSERARARREAQRRDVEAQLRWVARQEQETRALIAANY